MMIRACLLLSALTLAASAAEFTFKESPGALDVLCDGKVIARYMHAHDASTPEKQAETYKPYLHVFDADGTAPITKGAGGAYTHHRGIFIGWNKIGVGGKSYDRWHMKGGDQIHTEFTHQSTEKGRATFTSLVRWTGDTLDKSIIEEERTLTFNAPPAPAYAFIDMVSSLRATAGDVTLDGDPEHSGLHFRPADEVEREKTTYLYPVEDAKPHRDRDYPWFGESFTVAGKRYSVVYLNHPSNPKGAAISAYRDYGRFGAFWKAKMKLGEERSFRARFLVYAGELPEADAIQKAWNQYAGKKDPTPKTTAKPAELGKSPDSKKKAAAATPAPKPVATPAPKPAEQPSAEVKPQADAGPKIKRAGGGPEDPVLKFNPPPPKILTPQEELKTIKLPKGFRAELVASEPTIQAPIAVSWDDQARMYVLEMRGYMHDMDATGEDQRLGRVTRLEDTDGDGTYEKSTIFADKLLMPRAVIAVGDGALIAEPPNLIFFHDTDGDGVSDKKEVIHDAYAREGGQPEHMANSPTWMMDNWIWSSGHGFRYRYSGGTFLREATTGFGQWGRTQDDWGRQYFNYNSDWLRLDLVMPGLYARNARLATRSAINYQTTKVQSAWPSVPTPGVNRGYMEKTLRPDGTLQNCTGTCGATIYRGDLFPKEYRGNAFIPEPCGLLVKRLVLNETGGVVSAKHAYEGKEFLTSSDERFRPVNAYTGPDGALYVVDMARGVIQHKGFITYYLAANIMARKLEQPVNLGRIWRIVPEGAKPVATKLPKASADIVPLLAHGNGWVRDTAQRVLVERGDKAVVPAVAKLANEGEPLARLHALWTLEGLTALTPEIITAALQDKDAKVRAAAVRLADATLTPELLKLVPKADAEARLHLAFKLSDQQGPEVEQALIALLKSEGQAAAKLPAPAPEPATTDGGKKSGPPPSHAQMVGEAVASGLTGRELEFIEALLKQPVADDTKLEPTKILATLAGCVMAERRGSRVARLLELTATQPASRQSTIFSAMAPKKPLPNPVRMEGEPTAFVALQKTTKAGFKSAMAKIDAELYWPNKPGAKPLPEIIPLTTEQQASFEKGKALYAAVCSACHQPTGTGLVNLAPPLANSEWVLGPADRPIRAVLHGVTGPITVSGTKYNLEMPPLGAFPDDDVAAIITYIRREWDHGASPVTGADIAKVRELTKDRAKAWTEAELKLPPGAPPAQVKADATAKPKAKKK